MNSIADSSVIIQTSPQSVPSLPSWFGEVAMIAAYLRKLGILTKIAERVRFARKRFGCYEVIDFVAVLFGYAISGEHTLQAFYERLAPFAQRTWPSSGARIFQLVRRSRAFWRRSPKSLLKLCAAFFSTTWWRRPFRKIGKPGE